MATLLDQVGGSRFVNDTVAEFYGAVARHFCDADTADHRKQQSRQAQFLSHALSETPEPVRSSRASFLARGVNPTLFEALLEFLEARLTELGFSCQLSSALVQSASTLYSDCDPEMAIAC
jgi:truncated hemoglobin YjbI